MKADDYLLLNEKLCLVESETFLPQRALYKESSNKRKKMFHRHYLQVLCAFLCGFFMAYTTLIFYDRYLVWSVQIEQHSTNTEYYQTGYMTALKELETEETTLHEELVKSVRVLCMILTCPKYHEKRAIHIKNTWGRRCSKLIFMSSENDVELNAIAVIDPSEDEYNKLWNKTRESLRYVYENHLNEYDWFVKADDDTYMIMENLRYMLYAYEPNLPLYFGYEMNYRGVDYMSGGASYVLSREALKLFMQKSYNNDTLCPAADCHSPEDLTISKCLQNAGVLLVNSKSASENDKKTKFFPLQLLDFTEPEYNKTIPQWMFEMSVSSVEVGLDCCSNYSVAFHYMNPALLYSMEFLLYHMQLFGLHRPIGKLPKKISKEDVYEKFTKNITLPIEV